MGGGQFEDVNDGGRGGRYVGQLQDATRHGHGILGTLAGFVYEGEFYKNEMHGLGIRRYQNGDKYGGNSVAGAIHGTGKM
jgi:hypothetical protein